MACGLTVTPLRHALTMTTQLRLIDGGEPTILRLDKRTRAIGRRGVAQARLALQKARPPLPRDERGAVA
jgi:hypothetical protein